MAQVVTFGEAMVRLSPPPYYRLENATTLAATIGGAELNVAAGVSRLGIPAEWVSCLPDNSLGRMARNKAREMGVATEHIRWGSGDRMGLYFVEYGASPRASSVLYDRASSAISRVEPGSFDWQAILGGARIFHTTGITTALSDAARQEVRRSLEIAHQQGVLVSYDLNYRAKLWSEAEARAAQEPLMQYVDVLFTTEEDTKRVFGISHKNYRDVAAELADRYGLRVVAITLRGDTSVQRNTWTAIAYADGQFVEDRQYDIEIVDRIGGGDAFVAGFLYGFIVGDVNKGVQYGNAFSALKQTSWGDLNWATLNEVEAQLQGAGLRIVR